MSQGDLEGSCVKLWILHSSVNCVGNPLGGALSQGDEVISSQSVCAILFCMSEPISARHDDVNELIIFRQPLTHKCLF